MDPEQHLIALEESVRDVISATEKFLANGGEFSREEQIQLVKFLELSGQRIFELREAIAAEEEKIVGLPIPKKPELPPAPYPSSNINSFKYDPENEQLFVKFHGKDTADSGPIYSYEGVPKYIFDVFRRGAIGPRTSGVNQYHRWIKGVTPSLGGTMNALIKAGQFPYTRLAA